ncbi:hypothetical protein D3C76_1746800 [compost metagenome]
MAIEQVVPKLLIPIMTVKIITTPKIPPKRYIFLDVVISLKLPLPKKYVIIKVTIKALP